MLITLSPPHIFPLGVVDLYTSLWICLSVCTLGFYVYAVQCRVYHSVFLHRSMFALTNQSYCFGMLVFV
ncbi:hypothetical protein RSAG8_00519, partial [Rhizoctonia solani AG-8 WAC10335]